MPFLKRRNKVLRSRQLEQLTKRNGLRRAIFNTVGDRYIGVWNDDLKSGKGTILTRFRQLYEGDMQEGYRHGFGILAYGSKNKSFVLEYRGNWKQGRFHGFGLRRFRDGGVYVGEWKIGKRHGYGMMWYPNGEFYAGDWIKNKREGCGTLVKPNYNRYEGCWYNDVKHGKGRYLHLITGQKQKGVWIRDVCVFSIMIDIPYRQLAMHPSKHPFHQIELIHADDLCYTYEMKALQEIVNSCLSIHESLSLEYYT